MYMGIIFAYVFPKPAENNKNNVGGDLRLAVIAGTFRASFFCFAGGTNFDPSTPGTPWLESHLCADSMSVDLTFVLKP